MKFAKMLIVRIHNSARFAKVLAINLLVSLLQYVAFPIKSFLTFYLNKSNINDFAGMYKEDNLKQAKYQTILEVRTIALASLIEEVDYLITPETIKIITDFLLWEMPIAQKTEFRKANTRILQKIYQNEEINGIQEAIKIINAVGKL